MILPDERIVKFLRRHHVMTLATQGNDGIWCSNIFYTYVPALNIFVFTSDPATRHGRDMLTAPHVAGSVVLETRIVGRIQGAQLEGTARQPSGEDEATARRAYLKKFPYAAAARLDLWILEPETLKFTDNTLGFGRKLRWTRHDGNLG